MALLKTLSRAATAGALSALVSLGAIDAAAAMDDVTLRINFTPWGMHAPLYGGLKQGFFEDEGINLTIRPPSAGQQNEVFIGTGREEFGLANADSFIKARASGLPVIAFMADEPDTPFSVITLKESGIDTPEEMKGKKLSWFQTNVKGLVEPLFKAGGLTLDDVEFVVVSRGAEQQMLAAGQVDALFGYSFGQALTMEMRGYPTNVMALSDYGVKFYGTVFYTSESLLADDPDLVERFARAVLKSYMWADENNRAAVEEIIKVSPDRDLDLETKKSEIIFDLYKSPDYKDNFGKMYADKWASSIDILDGAGFLDTKPAPEDLFTNAIVEKLPESAALAKQLQGSGS
ncbi:ABC transporter substrate-binding protein [Acuticoccus mangrovi]|uniref:ABC transporter substrate-binding protein n=1 Tax=Acuticoccus mangrovi TaxID=2796142 RepID=A0A934ILK1_9HYPH|nr:ABC transporter substrate-binding protein [Acuticoccus mangrovi]MBJ3774621.1 ABC transporter substrate-binding protein [Acuticoccus mangrovi]